MFNTICMKTLKQNLKSLTKRQREILKFYCKNSNALYNSALYLCNEYYKQTGKYIGYNNLYYQMKDNIHYKNMTSFNAQEILKLVDQNYRSFFSLLRRKQKNQYKGEVRPPRYRKPKSEYILIFNKQRVVLKNNILKFTKDLKIKFTYNPGKIIQAIIKPDNYGNYTLLLTYEEDQDELSETLKDNFLAIDLGLDNLATCVSNVDNSFILNGKPLKSYNNFYNKQKAKFISELKRKNNKSYSKKLANLDYKREQFIDNYMNQSVAFIGKYCIENKIGIVILGYNETWKDNINLGRKTNQQFTDIPYYKLREKLRSKLNNLGIKLKEVNEAYTSKCSAIDNEPIKKHSNYMGKRVKRGLFESANGTLINADCNGACNIARKVISKADANEIWVVIVTPKVLNPINL